MSQAHRKPKAPDAVRAALLAAAARLAAEGGAAAVTIPAVAAAAGVTKGAVFHHFGDKQGLVAAAAAHLVAALDAEIDALIEAGPPGRGRFTRAYVASVFAAPQRNPFATLSLALLTDPTLAAAWADWLRGRLERHRDTDAGADLEAVRLAADGFWLAELTGIAPHVRAPAPALRDHLLALVAKGPTP